jgi:hypothetical protein
MAAGKKLVNGTGGLVRVMGNPLVMNWLMQ